MGNMYCKGEVSRHDSLYDRNSNIIYVLQHKPKKEKRPSLNSAPYSSSKQSAY